jgi:anti-sigma factor RsiW
MSSGISETDLANLNALVDGELDQSTAAKMERRIALDVDLRSARDTIAATRESVGRLPRPAVSAALLERIESLAGPAVTPKASHSTAQRSFSWRSLAASIVVSALVASVLTYSLVGGGDNSVDQSIAAAHRRSLLAASAVDVASSDRHTVKPWLDARLGVSPPAPDLTTSGFALAGGRVDVLEQQVVPTLVYRHNEHTISLIARPANAGAAAPHDFSSGGYNMVRWTAAGFLFTAVSDLEPGELDAFVADYRSQLEADGANR